jgi:WD40 repeat protein
MPATDAWALAFSPDGTMLYGGSWFRLLRWNLATAELTSLATEHHGLIRSLQFGPNGRYLASISRQTDSAVLFLEPATGKVLDRFAKHDLCGAYIAISADGHFLATTSNDATVRIWNLEGRSDMNNDPKHDNSYGGDHIQSTGEQTGHELPVS